MAGEARKGGETDSPGREGVLRSGRQKPQEEEGPGRGAARPRGDRTTGRQVSSASTHVTGRGGETPWGRGWGAADADLRAPCWWVPHPCSCTFPLRLTSVRLNSAT